MINSPSIQSGRAVHGVKFVLIEVRREVASVRRLSRLHTLLVVGDDFFGQCKDLLVEETSFAVSTYWNVRGGVS